MGFSLALCAAAALGQGVETHRPLVPSAGIATENGPGALWVNPANLAYDPDPRYGLFAGRQPLASVTSLAATGGIDGLSVGIHNRLRPDGADLRSDWSLDYGSSIALPERLAVGLLFSWNFIEAGTNYLAYDAGLSWRPLPWLGLSGVAQNVGSPDPAGVARPRTGAGLALRPGRGLLLGVDLARTFGGLAPDDPSTDHLVATARVRPLEGLYLRANATSEVVEEGIVFASAGAGLELYFGGTGLGAHYGQDADGLSIGSLYLGTDEPGESLIRSGRRVPVLEIAQTPAYQPRSVLFSDKAPSWLEILELLRRVEDERGIRGLVLSLEGTGLSLAQHRELRDRIAALEAADRPVLVYLGQGAGNAEIYVASAASRVALHPAADVSFIGVGLQLTHLRGLLDLVGVEAQFVRRAKYKTAPESFTHPSPSPANLEMHEVLLDDLYNELVDRVAEGRGVDADVVRGWIDFGPMTSDEALEKGVVDVLLYPDQLEAELEKLHKGSISASLLLEQPQPRSPWEDPKQIAIVYVEGAIVSGKSAAPGLLSGRRSGAKTVARQLRRARQDPQVRGVVLRVDSPGGSSLASDAIWREIERLKARDKPVVVSMGGVAASGGYYVAAGADAIWAQPETLTGSIGVYSGKFTTSELQEALGVSTTVLGRGRHASIRSGTVPWDDVQRSRMQALVDHTYAQFKDRVATGRDLEPSEVEDVAQGRVWSGRRALDLGLVDQLGGFQDAIADARARADIPASSKVGLVTYSERGSVLESLAPALATRLAPVLGLGDPDRPALGLARALAPLDPLLVPTLYPDEHVWMLDPWHLEIVR